MRKARKLPEKMKATQFKPGQSGNPKGRPRLTQEERALRDLTLKSYRKIIKSIFSGNREDLQEMAEDPDASMATVLLASAVIKAAKTGDYAVTEKIVERVIGKIPDEVNLTSNNVNLNAELDPVKLKAALDKIESDI